MIFLKWKLIIKIFAIILFMNEITNASSGLTSEPTLTRCPEKTNKTGIYLYQDKKLCNVFHECFCNNGNESVCNLVKSNVCPLGKIFYNATNKCEPIEAYGCETLYLQGINATLDQTLERDYDYANSKVKLDLPLESTYVGGISEFICPYGSNERFPDPQICNVFHVCVSRGEQTYDQPFMCPFSSVFRVIDSNTMYCDKRSINDCKDKAFYRSLDDEFVSFGKKSDILLIEETSNATECENNEIYEDDFYCNTYHVCKDKKDRHFVCENNLLFNPMSLMCDYPINVVCSFKQIFKKEELVTIMPTEFDVKTKSKDTEIEDMSVTIEPNIPKIQLINNTLNIVNHRKIFGVKIDLKCPRGAKNYLYPDTQFCNVFHHCDGNQGNILLCEKGQAFDPLANGPEASGVCNFENLVDCEGKFILTEFGKRAGQPLRLNVQQPAAATVADNSFKNNVDIKQIEQTEYAREELISGVKFDCRSKTNGHWRDYRYCDVFHACISNEQKKTYSCAQLGERIYFNETTKRCEFLKYNPSACPTNTFFNQVPASQNSVSKTLDEPNENWKHFIKTKEQFRCIGLDGMLRADGFYASRWCNVFYRCFLGIKTEFLCPKMLNSDRLWWVQHGSSQETAQTSAACVWPCETKKQCTSPGGTLIQNFNGSYWEESAIETERIWRASSCGDEKLATNDMFKISDSSFNCNGLTEGSFYPSKYCNIFHRCASGKRKDFKCPKANNGGKYDLWWNPITSQCDWPCKVNCNDPIYGSQKKSFDIKTEDYYLNEEECRRSQYVEYANVQPTILKLEDKKINVKPLDRPYPDDFLCSSPGLFISSKYCNVYYECKNHNKLPHSSFYCIDGHFDEDSKSCVDSKMSSCAYKPSLVYPLISIEETNLPEEASCSYKIGSYIMYSNRYCNMYYLCNGRSTKPDAFKCFDKQTLSDGVYSRKLGKCVSKYEENCHGEFFLQKPKYQSSPIPYTRFSDLQPLACKSDQQYLAEHDRYCNLFHSCILGKYQMYACIATGSHDKASFFYYTNGDCSAPNLDQCGPKKSIYPYSKLFRESIQSNIRIINETVVSNFGPKLIKGVQSAPKCEKNEEFLSIDNRYCNVYHECLNAKLSTYVCIDMISGNKSGVFDSSTKMCKQYTNLEQCVSNNFYVTAVEVVEDAEKNNSSKILIKNEDERNVKTITETLFLTGSNFSCVGLKDGYYESEYCNVYYRCINGKRTDSRCSSGKVFGSFVEYDLWWFYQSATYNSSNPMSFDGDDSEAQCEFPCKVKCNKKIWTEKDVQTWNSILDRDLDIHPECSLPENMVTLPSPEVESENLEIRTTLPIKEPKSKSTQRFVMANLKQKIKDILNSKQNASANKIIWNDW